jgi:hypothetical protein
LAHYVMVSSMHRASREASRPQVLLASMMASSHYGYVDASGSKFAHVGRDQNNITTVNNNITIVNNNMNITVFGSAPISHVLYCVRDAPQWPTCRPDTLDRGRLPAVTSHPPNVGSPGDVAGLIVQITQALIDCRASSNDYRDLKLELESLHQMLVLTGLAIQAYEGTPLGRTLTETINFEVEQCGKAVQELLSEINLYRRSLIPTRLRVLWSQVWYCGREKGELAQWRRKLSVRRISIAMFLMALNSYALLIIHSFMSAETSHLMSSLPWMELGNELRAGRVSLRKFHCLLEQYPVFLHHIQLSTVKVVDHLGQSIPIPSMFCSAWKVGSICSMYLSSHAYGEK